MTDSSKEQKQTIKSNKKDIENLSNNFAKNQDKNVKEVKSKNKSFVKIIFLIFIAFILGIIVTYGIYINSPKYKYIKALSLKSEPIKQAVLNGNLDIEKYDLTLSNEGLSISHQPVNFSGSSIIYNGKIDFISKLLEMQIILKYNNKEYPITAYLTSTQLILNLEGFFDLYQINVPKERRIQIPQYIYTTEENQDKIIELWNNLEVCYSRKNNISNHDAAKDLINLIFKSIPGKYFSKKDSGEVLLNFDGKGLKMIIDSIIGQVWSNNKLFAKSVSRLVSNNPQDIQDIEKEILEHQKQITKNEALEKANQIWKHFDRFLKLNEFSLGIKNKPPVYLHNFVLHCSIKKSNNFPNGGKIILNGENEITIKKEVFIKIPNLNNNNSININNIEL